MKIFSLLLFTLTAISSLQAATITIETFGAQKHKNLPDLHLWQFTETAHADNKELVLNPELGEKGSVFIEEIENGEFQTTQLTYVPWEFAINGNTVHAIDFSATFARMKNSAELIRDTQVAERTNHLLSARALNSDITYFHYVNRYSQLYLEPFVYFGAEEKKKYSRLFDSKNVLIQSLGKGPQDYLTTVSENLVNQDNWAKFARHTIEPSNLRNVFEDSGLAQFIVYVRGEDKTKYLAPGANEALQKRTVTVIWDLELSPDTLLTSIDLPEPVFFTNILSLHMRCQNQSARLTLDWILTELTVLSGKPSEQGASTLSANGLLEATKPCINQLNP